MRGHAAARAGKQRAQAVVTRVASIARPPVHRTAPPARREGEAFDLVLSSGFLAFANHSGFLQAVEEAGVRVAGVMGTSAGALAGSLYAAGYSPRQVSRELSRVAPIDLLKLSAEPWNGGLLSLEAVVDRLAQLLPATFEELPREFAVGVVTADGQHELIDSGPLPAAVAASAAIPVVFSQVEVPGRNMLYKDGGVVDRVGLVAWRQRRRAQLARRGSSPHSSAAPVPQCLVHVIERSSPFSGTETAGLSQPRVHIVRSPKSGVSFFDLGDYDRQFDLARTRTRMVLELLQDRTGAGIGIGGGASIGGGVAAGGSGTAVHVPTVWADAN